MLAAMGASLAHRGPDAGAQLIEPLGHGIMLGLAHRRLAILDLSEAGAQPMVSADGRWLFAYNGEIYNAPEVQRLVEQHRSLAWRGHSDTEVALEAIACMGVEKALGQLNGMFAFAAYDRAERRLWLARDRMGEKPLYWGWLGGRFVFASEPKALAVLAGDQLKPDPVALRQYLAFGYVPAPRSAFECVGKLRPGHLLSVAADARPGAQASNSRAWWRLPRPQPQPIGRAEAADRFETLIADAVAQRMRSDVPMGAFLSGGIDSSTILALMQRQATGPVESFTMGFDSAAHDETRHAAQVAAALGTRHHRMEATPAAALALVPRLAGIYDEPFADSSAIPTLLLAELVRGHVTVALSGDGGDELFGGYARYLAFERGWQRLQLLPPPVRRAAGALLFAVHRPLGAIAQRLPGPLAGMASAGRLAKLARVARARDVHGHLGELVSFWPSPGAMDDCDTAFGAHDIGRDFAHPVLGMTYVDQLSYLPDDILVKVDRATMAVGLEARVPFLDHRIVEEAARLPLERRLAAGRGKLVLRDILARHLPPELVDRPKQGFSLPLGRWLRGPLRDWAQARLGHGLGDLDGLVDRRAVEALWRRHLKGLEDAADRLWVVLMLVEWQLGLAERLKPPAALVDQADEAGRHDTGAMVGR